MSPNKILFKPEYSSELFGIAKGDLKSARELLGATKEGRLENVVYLAQQAAEKALKAALNHLRIPFPLVHDLGILVALLPDDKVPPGSFDLALLNPYASALRYEEPNAILTQLEVEASLQAVQAVIDWAEQIFR
jgi:HEPN domain-containing protein